ncbi:glutathione synthase [Alphaproteobacteria bacterium]|nr:glutathione synthase [Alphaproteobacteria bacterium]
MKNFLFQMDDPKKINIKEDSTYMLIKESLSRGIRCFYNSPSWVYATINKSNKIRSLNLELDLNKSGKLAYKSKNFNDTDLEKFNAIFIRQDPPFNMEYISNTYLLSQLKKPTFINDPSEVRNFPEKHIMMNFPELTPPTLISSNIATILSFIKKHKEVILKPAYGNGGIGIEKIQYHQKNLQNFLIKYISKFQNNPVIIQKFLKNFNKGDKRIILVNGVVKGAVLRVPKKNSIKANFHAGGVAVKTTLTSREKKICTSIKKFLINKKLSFVGIDVIDGYLTEINITSPTGIQEINRLNKVTIEKDVIDFVEKSLQ